MEKYERKFWEIYRIPRKNLKFDENIKLDIDLEILLIASSALSSKLEWLTQDFYQTLGDVDVVSLTKSWKMKSFWPEQTYPVVNGFFGKALILVFERKECKEVGPNTHFKRILAGFLLPNGRLFYSHHTRNIFQGFHGAYNEANPTIKRR